MKITPFQSYKVAECPECKEKFRLKVYDSYIKHGGLKCDCGNVLGLNDVKAIVCSRSNKHVCNNQKLTDWDKNSVVEDIESETLYCSECLYILEPTKFYQSLEEFEQETVIREAAEELHKNWMDWSKSIAEEEDLSEERKERWEEECWKPYSELSEEMKKKDKKRARKMLRKLEILK